MKEAVLVRVEGVLSADDSYLGLPRYEGKLLYLSLIGFGFHPIFLVEENSAMALHWLDREMDLASEVHMVAESAVDDPIRHCRSLGHNVVFVLTADAQDASRALLAGVTPVYLPAPEYARAEFRPGVLDGVLPWQQIVDTVEEQRRIRREDKRVAP